MSIKGSVKLFVRRFANDRTAIVTLWGMVFIGMAVYFICWFTMGLPLIYFIDVVRDELTGLSTMGEQVIDGCLFAFEIHPAIALLGWFIYGIMHSAKRDTDVYKYS